MSKATISARNNEQKKPKHVREQTETEIIDVTIPYIAIPSPSELIEEDNVLQTDITQEEFQDDVSSDDTETIVYTGKKNSWVWPFYRQVQTSDGNIVTVCEVEIGIGVKCNKRYKVKGSTGNLINHLLKHGITKDNPQPTEVYKTIIVYHSYSLNN